MRSKLLALALLLPLAGQAATLRAFTGVAESAGLVATCYFSTNTYGDLRACSSGDGPTNNVTPLSVETWATYTTGAYGIAKAQAKLGTLKASALASVPAAGDGVGHNLQSQAIAEMQDTLLAGTSYGALVVGYNYNVLITGSATPSTPVYALPDLRAGVFVHIGISNAATGEVLASTYWETTPLQLSNGSISGSFSAPAGTLLSLAVFMQADATVVTTAGGSGGVSNVDYSNTVHVYLDAATSGANTVGTSGYDYATAAAVPEPASLWTLGMGLGLLARRRRSRNRTGAHLCASAAVIADMCLAAAARPGRRAA